MSRGRGLLRLPQSASELLNVWGVNSTCAIEAESLCVETMPRPPKCKECKKAKKIHCKERHWCSYCVISECPSLIVFSDAFYPSQRKIMPTVAMRWEMNF